MNVIRITEPDQVIQYWDVFKEGLRMIAKLTSERVSNEEYLKLLTNLAVQTDIAWIGLAFQGGPLSYGVAIDSTLPQCNRRTFTVASFYAMPGRPDATAALMEAFETWARENGVASYVVTTRRDTGAAIKCFKSARYGFRKSYTAFEKYLI
jgi:hypothetical protein